MKRAAFIISLIAALLLPAAFAQDESPEGQAEVPTLATALYQNPDYSDFARALEITGLIDVIENDQRAPLTVLVPSNEAFQQAGIDIEEMDEDSLYTLIEHHILQGALSEGPGDMGRLETLAGGHHTFGDGAGQPVAEGEAVDNEVAGGGEADQDENDQAEGGMGNEEQDAQAEEGAGMSADQIVGMTISGATILHAELEPVGGEWYGIDTVLMPDGFGGAGEAAGDGAEGGEASADETPATPEGQEDEGAEETGEEDGE